MATNFMCFILSSAVLVQLSKQYFLNIKLFHGLYKYVYNVCVFVCVCVGACACVRMCVYMCVKAHSLLFQLLRQQLVYNILVKSCFGSASSHLSPGKCTTQLEALCFYHPKLLETSDTELVCSIIEITPPSTIRLEASLMGTGPIAMVINVDQGKPTTPEVHLGDNFQNLSANLVLSQILSK